MLPMMNSTVPSRDEPVASTAARFGAGNVGLEALIPSVACTFLASVVVGLRWYTRCRITRCVGLDDYVILLSLSLSWAMCIVIGESVFKGIGDYSGSADAIQTAKLILVNNTIWTILINVTKASILTQYLRIFGGSRTRHLCQILMFLLILAALWGIFGGIFLCSPVAKLWNPVLNGHCRSAKAYWSSVAAVDIFLDFAVLLLPMPSVAGLHLPRRQKVATVLVFALGFMVCFVSVVRLATVLIASQQGDYVMSGIWSIIWSAIEANVGIVCACLLSLKALVTKLFPSVLAGDEPNPHHMHIASISNEWEPGDSEATTLGRSAGSLAKGETSRSNRPNTRAPATCVPPSTTRQPPHHKPTDSGVISAMGLKEMLSQDSVHPRVDT